MPRHSQLVGTNEISISIEISQIRVTMAAATVFFAAQSAKILHYNVQGVANM